jgi:hypothetical protein
VLIVLLASAAIAIEPTPTDPLTIAAGGTVIGMVAGLAVLLIRTSNRRGEGWTDVMKQWQSVADANLARAVAAEEREAALRKEVAMAWEAARFATHERDTWEQRFHECERLQAGGA